MSFMILRRHRLNSFLLQVERKRTSWKMVEEDCEGSSSSNWLLSCELLVTRCCLLMMHRRSEEVRRVMSG